jgi:hypothetical protein
LRFPNAVIDFVPKAEAVSIDSSRPRRYLQLGESRHAANQQIVLNVPGGPGAFAERLTGGLYLNRVQDRDYGGRSMSARCCQVEMFDKVTFEVLTS